jgi:glutathione S-transferase
MFRGQTSIDASKRKKWDEAMNYFNTFLADQDYAAGNHLTIADLSLIASASTMEVYI